jgi:hypothetical protein
VQRLWVRFCGLKESWKEGKSCLWISMLSTLRHFHSSVLCFLGAPHVYLLVAPPPGRPGVGGRQFLLTWFDREGKVLNTFGQPGDDQLVALAPDGTRAVIRDGSVVTLGDRAELRSSSKWILNRSSSLDSLEPPIDLRRASE